MIKLFFDLKENKKIKNGYFSIINEKNIISKENISNLLQFMASYKTLLDSKKLLTFDDLKLKFDKDEIKSLNPLNKNDVKNEEQNYLRVQRLCMNILLDYIFFENIFTYEPKNNEINSIYDKYELYYGGLTVFHNDNYSYIYDYKNHQNETNLNNDYKKWNQYIREESKNEGLKMLFKLVDNMFNQKSEKLEFNEMIFIFLDLLINTKERYKEDISYINAIIKLIISNDGKILKEFMKSNKKDKYKIFKRIIYNIREYLSQGIGFGIKEIAFSENSIMEEYLNSLVILLESFGEYKNNLLLQFIFEKEENIEECFFDRLIDIYERLFLDFWSNKINIYDIKTKKKINSIKFNN